MTVIGTYGLQSLQIYFNASLELQEELIRNGFRIPQPTPIPIIYANYAGYQLGRGPSGPSKGASIHPSRYGKTLSQMGWRDYGKYFGIPPEVGGSVKLVVDGDLLHLQLRFSDDKPNYHLEKVSYRQVSPTIWKNWVMFYLGLDDLNDIVNKLCQAVNFPTTLCGEPVYFTHEPLQRGLEDTYFISFDKKKLGSRIHSFSLCLGCFDYVIDYFTHEFQVPSRVRLRLEKDEDVPMFMKLGAAKIKGKSPQLMVKLASDPGLQMEITGLGNKKIKGKCRGNVVPCNHMNRKNVITVDAKLFLRAVCATRHLYFPNLTSPLRDRDCSRCYSLRKSPPWISLNNSRG